jgi:homoaconitate hydratase
MLNPELGAKGRFNHDRINDLSRTSSLPTPVRPTPNRSTSIFQPSPPSFPALTPLRSPRLRDLEAQKIPINKAYLVSCTNSRASDIAAARVFREAAEGGATPKIAPGVNFYIAAASLPEQRIAEDAGGWQVLLNAGAEPLPSGCGPCIGLDRSPRARRGGY